LEAGNWVYLNWKYVAGISFLPKKNSAYEQEQMPEETITKEEYEKLKKDFPKIDYSQLGKYELEDNTTGAKAYACTGGSCDI
jgi:hypothetical protein